MAWDVYAQHDDRAHGDDDLSGEEREGRALMEGSGAALSIDGSRTNDGSDVRREKRDEQDHRPNVPALGCIGIQHLGP